MAFTHELIITSAQLEFGYNHVNHAHILTLLEYGRLALLEHLGHPNTSFIERQLFLVIARIDAQYKREIFAGPLTVTVDKCAVEGKDLIMDQSALNERGKVCTQARLWFRMLDGKVKRSIEIPTEFCAALHKFELGRA